MKWLEFIWHESDGGVRALWRDLRSGRAGWLVRVGLSLAGAAVAAALAMGLLGIIEAGGRRVSDGAIAMGLAIAGVVWCVGLTVIWSGYRRWRRILLAVFAIIGVWLVAIPLAVVIEETIRRAELLITCVIFLAIGATILIGVTAGYRARGGVPVEERPGHIRVRCPGCGYSMVGLRACVCPECGEEFTIDELIRGQDYEAHRAPEWRGPPQLAGAEPAEEPG